MPKINIEKLHRGYRLTDWTHRSFVLTAQDLRDIYDWCLLHMAELEQEAIQAEFQEHRRNARLGAYHAGEEEQQP